MVMQMKKFVVIKEYIVDPNENIIVINNNLHKCFDTGPSMFFFDEYGDAVNYAEKIANTNHKIGIYELFALTEVGSPITKRV